MAQDGSVTFTMENPAYTLWSDHSVTNVVEINKKGEDADITGWTKGPFLIDLTGWLINA